MRLMRSSLWRVHFSRRAFIGMAQPLILLAMFTSTVPAQSVAEWTPGAYMIQALGEMMDAMLRLQGATDFGYDDDVSIMAAFLQPKDTIEFVRYVEKGQRYLFVGGGDNDVRDLDIAIFDDRGQPIASDTKKDNHPIAFWTATYSGKITIKLGLFDAARGSFCVVSVMREGGWNIPKENLIKAGSQLILSANSINQQVKSQVGFQAGSNQWALYGGVYRVGEQMAIDNIGLGSGRRVIMAAGDTLARDIDLYMQIGDRVFKDVDSDALPIIDITATNVTSAKLRMKNVEAGGASLILTTILQIAD